MIEAFVAITVLLIAVLGPLTLITRAIIDGNYAKYQVTASLLMQEGLDLAVAKAAEFSDKNDLSEMGPGCSQVSPCRIYFDQLTDSVKIEPNFNISDSFLYTDALSGIYSHNASGVKTIFRRTIWFEDVTDGLNVGGMNRMSQIGLDPIVGKKVIVQLTWDYRGVSRTQTATTIVYE